MEKKILHLSVSKQWFDMIASGEKKEEYRKIKKYWKKRLFNIVSDNGAVCRYSSKPFTHVSFTNGYGDDKPRIEKKIERITIGRPRKGWCPDEFLDKQYFVIKLK